MTTVEIRVQPSGQNAHVATSYVDDKAFVWATDTTERAAVKACMVLTRTMLPGEPLSFRLPFCGKRFHVPWWERQKPLSLQERIQIRRRGLASDEGGTS